MAGTTRPGFGRGHWAPVAVLAQLRQQRLKTLAAMTEIAFQASLATSYPVVVGQLTRGKPLASRLPRARSSDTASRCAPSQIEPGPHTPIDGLFINPDGRGHVVQGKIEIDAYCALSVGESH